MPLYTWPLPLADAPDDRPGTVAAGAGATVPANVVVVAIEDDDVGVVKGFIPAGSAPPLADATIGRPDDTDELGAS